MTNEEYKEWREAKKLAKNVATYGCESCTCCRHTFDQWTELESQLSKVNGEMVYGRRKRPTIKDPHTRAVDAEGNRIPIYWIVPCENCPELFKKEFDARMENDKQVAFMLKNGF